MIERCQLRYVRKAAEKKGATACFRKSRHIAVLYAILPCEAFKSPAREGERPLGENLNRGTGAARRSRGRPKVTSDTAKREKIVNCARELFAREGYVQSTMEKIATHCKMSKRTLYRLFPSKEDLFVAIVETHRQTMLALPCDYDDLPLTEALERIFKIDLDEKQERNRQAFIRMAIQETGRHPDLETLFLRHGPEKAHSLLGDWFARQSDAGRIVINDPGTTAKMLMDMIFGAVVHKPGQDFEWPSREKRQAYIRRCIDIFINGIRAR